MRLFEKSHDGGTESGVTGYFLVEIKPLFSVVLLRFSKGTREAYHSHAFHAVTMWLKGKVIEHHRDGRRKFFRGGMVKYTGRNTFHKVEALETTWAISFRGPWLDRWHEDRQRKLVTLTHGRNIVDE
jgi:quercetin dioxygenase-like cupin family protein